AKPNSAITPLSGLNAAQQWYLFDEDCIRVLGSEEASKHKFINTKCACANRLKSCSYWVERHTSEQTRDEGKGDEGDEKGERNAFQLTFHTPLSQLPPSRNLNNFFYTTPSITSHRSSVTDISNISSQSFIPLDNYVYPIKELFKWINPILCLPSQKQLSDRILERTTNKISETILNDAINDDLENNMIIWKIEDINGKRCKGDIVIDETKKSFEQLEQKQIK
ncbi:2082_t:CDS:2, partial [Funneliformis caledonium]